MRSIGRLHVGSDRTRDKGCTATLVDSRIILTAAHCVKDDTGVLKSNVILFEIGATWENQGPTFEADPTKIITGEWTREDWWGADWALIVLKKKVDPKRYPPISIIKPSSEANLVGKDVIVTLTGYPYDSSSPFFGRGVTEQVNLTNLYARTNILTYTCERWGGMSGAPLYQRSGQGLTIFGIHNGAREDGKCYGLESAAFSRSLEALRSK